MSRGNKQRRFDLDAVTGLPLAEDGVEPIDLPCGDTSVERFGDAVGEPGYTERMRRHGAFPDGGDAPFGGDRAASGSDQEQIGGGEIATDRIQDMLAESAGKSLLSAE
jgi:hypothetical protein